MTTSDSRSLEQPALSPPLYDPAAMIFGVDRQELDEVRFVRAVADRAANGHGGDGPTSRGEEPPS